MPESGGEPLPQYRCPLQIVSRCHAPCFVSLTSELVSAAKSTKELDRKPADEWQHYVAGAFTAMKNEELKLSSHQDVLRRERSLGQIIMDAIKEDEHSELNIATKRLENLKRIIERNKDSMLATCCHMLKTDLPTHIDTIPPGTDETKL